MVRRDFGSKNFNNSPVAGYDARPHYVAEWGAVPEQQAPSEKIAEWRRRRGIEESEEPEVGKLGNPELPMFDYREQIVEAIADSPVTIVVSETGSGKSTQVPQFLYEAGHTIFLTQPRRLPAREVAERIREEMQSVLADMPDEVVGCHTAERNDTTDKTRITVMTDGLRLVQDMNGRDGSENEVLIIDEVHEWNSNIEILVAWTKQMLKEKPNMRVVLMSATMEAQRIQNYFDDVTPQSPPIIEVPGRTHPVESREDPKSTIVKETIKFALDGKNVLVFVPGKREIGDTIDELERLLPPDIRLAMDILPLHSKLSDAEQRLATHSSGKQKIVVSTNVAQTSLTIPDIDAVVDSGLERRQEMNEAGVQGLMLRPISRADCMQRRGRAGRVKEGEYVLTRLDEDAEYVPFIQRDEYPVAEILRTDTSRHVLRTAAVGLDFRSLDLFHSLKDHVVDRAERYLVTLGALNADRDVTRTGLRMNEFPVRPSLGRMLVEADQLSLEVRAAMAGVAATMEAGGLRYFGQDVGRRWKKLTDEELSDQLAELDIFMAVKDGMSRWKQVGYDLDIKNIDRAKETYEKIAYRMGLPNGYELMPPTDAERETMLHCVYAGFGDDIYRHVGEGKYRRVVNGESDELRNLSNRSVVKSSPSLVVGAPYRYERKTRQGMEEKHIIGDVSAVPSVTALARAASHLCEWRPESIVWRDGLPRVREQEYFAGSYDLGNTREVIPESSAELRRAVIQYAIEHPGSAQQSLRSIKAELETLQHLTKQALPKLTHDMLLTYVDEAAPVNVADPEQIETNLRTRIHDENITLNSFVDAETREMIKQNAPEYIQATDQIGFHIKYRSGVPFVTQYLPADVAELPGEMYLPDGRHVLFVYNGKRVSRTKLLELDAQKKT